MPPRFLDTNILLRYLTRDDPAKAVRALALLQRVERGEEKVVISPLVVFETVFTLQHSYKVPRRQIQASMGDLLSLPGIALSHKQLYLRALELYATTNLSFTDAYTATSMLARGIPEIYSWDTDFDHVPGITRLEPPEPGAEGIA
jgi:predicted nucleic acid-binding protein